MTTRTLSMRISLPSLLAAAAVSVLLPRFAAAQEAAPPMPEDPRAPRYREVERGFFTGFEVGYLTLFKTPTADPAKYPFAPSEGGRSNGIVIGGTVGYDLTDRIALSIFGMGSASSASRSYGAFSLFAVGPDLRLALLTGGDAYAVDRLFVYLHARGGPLWTRPLGLFGDTDFYLGGGPGLEYFTHLRHFSIGIAADAAYVTKAKSFGVAVVPTVRYTF
jgi:hypothetical protein